MIGSRKLCDGVLAIGEALQFSVVGVAEFAGYLPVKCDPFIESGVVEAWRVGQSTRSTQHQQRQYGANSNPPPVNLHAGSRSDYRRHDQHKQSTTWPIRHQFQQSNRCIQEQNYRWIGASLRCVPDVLIWISRRQQYEGIINQQFLFFCTNVLRSSKAQHSNIDFFFCLLLSVSVLFDIAISTVVDYINGIIEKLFVVDCFAYGISNYICQYLLVP